jgi:hypothetical protein
VYLLGRCCRCLRYNAHPSLRTHRASLRIAELEQALSAKVTQAQKLQADVQEMARQCDDAALLRDELAVLRPMNAAFAKAEVTAPVISKGMSVYLTEQVVDGVACCCNGSIALQVRHCDVWIACECQSLYQR